MAGIFTLFILLGCLLFIIGFKKPKLSKLKKYGIALFIIGFTPFIIREIIAPHNDSKPVTQITHSTNTDSIPENPTTKNQLKEVNNVAVEVSPVAAEVQIPKEKAFDWDAFDASPERAELGRNVQMMQNNNLKGAHFLPVNYGKGNLEQFMRENNLKFTMASLDCFSSETHCSLTIAITRSKYPSKANGDFCGPMARWTAPYKDLNAWETDLRSPLDQLLFQGDAEGVLRKIDYEYERRCS